MSKFDKILEKLLDPSYILSFQELEYLLKKFNYEEKKTGKTSGSRKAYIELKSKHVLRIHKPHPENELKKYVKMYIIKELKNNGKI